MPRISSLTGQQLSGIGLRRGLYDAVSLSLQIPNRFLDRNDTVASSDYFGYAADISGNYAIIGCRGSYGNFCVIWDIVNGTEEHYLTNPSTIPAAPSGATADDNFGSAVSIHGAYAAVGAAYEDPASGTDYDTGAVYLYSVASGNVVRTFTNPNAVGTGIGDRFGTSVCLYENPSNSTLYLAVGAIEKDATNHYFNSGVVYVFNASTGSLLHTIYNPNSYGTSQSDYFGFGGQPSIDMCGDYMIAGARWEDKDNSGTEVSFAGAAYIFSLSTGNLVYSLTNTDSLDSGAGDQLGTSVAINEDYAAVGSPGEEDGGSYSGKVTIYRLSDGAKINTIFNPDAYGTPAGDYFGHSCSLSGRYLVVGAYREESVQAYPGDGHVYVFDVETGDQLVFSGDSATSSVNNPNPGGADYFGQWVAIDGRNIIVGAERYDGQNTEGTNIFQAGAAYVFKLVRR